jgi:hypothetical protein
MFGRRKKRAAESQRPKRRLEDCPVCKWEPFARECSCPEVTAHVQYVTGSTRTELGFRAVQARVRAQLTPVGIGNVVVRVTVNPDGSVTLPPLPPDASWSLVYLPYAD